MEASLPVVEGKPPSSELILPRFDKTPPATESPPCGAELTFGNACSPQPAYIRYHLPQAEVNGNAAPTSERGENI